uniref:Putative ubiquitin conjugating enzyme n=1 Tax=Tabanus bromius TaxID=304241 RepID=A0A0K8TT76_TABBR
MTLDTNNTSDKLLTTIQREYKILGEYKMIQTEDVGGVYVIPSHDNSFIWFGVIFVRDGYYSGGIFRFNISLPDNFPDDSKAPTVIFQNEIFHPLICPYTGTLDTSGAFPVWISGSNHIWQLLKYIQFIFNQPQMCLNAEKLPNQTASDLLSQNKAEFIQKVKECVNLSCDKVYDPPPTDDKHFIVFEKFDNEIHGPVLANMKSKEDISGSPPTSGLSWVNKGEFKPLSKE